LGNELHWSKPLLMEEGKAMGTRHAIAMELATGTRASRPRLPLPQEQFNPEFDGRILSQED
jgi:hypothetical protein